MIEEQLSSTADVVDYFIARFLRVSLDQQTRAKLIAFLNEDLGTSDIATAQTYMEDSLRLLLHIVMSQPEYQLS